MYGRKTSLFLCGSSTSSKVFEAGISHAQFIENEKRKGARRGMNRSMVMGKEQDMSLGSNPDE